jgi:PilZ domain
MKRRIGDRRGKPRFEIVGDLWGSVDVSASLVVVNLGRGGALLESGVPLVPGSVHTVSVVAEDESHKVTLRVRHSMPDEQTGRRRYLTGVEFVDVTPALDDFLVRQLAFGIGNLPLEAY